MATWVTHSMIADEILKKITWLDRRCFSVGNIAPDCNIPNEDWSVLTPSREVTHFMSGKTKQFSDSERFCDKYIYPKRNEMISNEQYSFLLGYYTHLIADASFFAMIHNEKRLSAALGRIKPEGCVSEHTDKWALIKSFVPKDKRMREIFGMEAEYLQKNPNSGYITEILTLNDFPDYIDILPHGSIAYKVRLMGSMPAADENIAEPVAISREEHSAYVNDTVLLAIDKFKEKALI